MTLASSLLVVCDVGFLFILIMDAAADVPLPPPFTPYQRMMTVLKAIPLGVGMTVENHYYDVHPDSLSVIMLEMKSRGIVFETLLNCTSAFYMQISVTQLTNSLLDELKGTLQNPEDAAVKGLRDGVS